MVLRARRSARATPLLRFGFLLGFLSKIYFILRGFVFGGVARAERLGRNTWVGLDGLCGAVGWRVQLVGRDDRGAGAAVLVES